MADSGDALVDKLSGLATEENFLHAYARRRAVDHYDHELIAFYIADECYALSITDLREIIKVPAITEVPRVPEFVRGVVTVRGRVIPAIDVRMRLGMPAAPLTRVTRVLVCEIDDEQHGLIVDAVRSVVRLSDDDVEPPPQVRSGGNDAEFLSGIGRDSEGLIILLDLPAVVSFTLDGAR